MSSMAPSPSPKMADLFQVVDVGTRAELLEEVVGALIAREEGDAALRVLEVAEDDRLGGARIFASRSNVAVRERRLLLQRRVLRELDTLNAETALLHHAARTHRHVGIQHHATDGARHVEIETRFVGEIVPVEPAHLVGAVVGAVTGSDATV